MAVPWGSILSGGVTLLGGLLGNSSAKKAAAKAAQEQKWEAAEAFGRTLHLTNVQNGEVRQINDWITEHNDRQDALGSGVDFAGLVRDAEAAGFNPLTAMRSGAAAGYTRTPQYMSYISPAGPSQVAQPLPVPVAQVTNAWGDAASAFVSKLPSDFLDPVAGDRQKLELGIARAQLENLQSDTARNNSAIAADKYRFRIPSWTDSGTKTVRGGGGKTGSNVTSVGNLTGSTPRTAGDAEVTNPWPAAWGIKAAPWRVNAAAWEDTYGEIAGEVAGALNIGSDLGFTLYKSPTANAAVQRLLAQQKANKAALIRASNERYGTEGVKLDINGVPVNIGW